MNWKAFWRGFRDGYEIAEKPFAITLLVVGSVVLAARLAGLL